MLNIKPKLLAQALLIKSWEILCHGTAHSNSPCVAVHVPRTTYHVPDIQM